MMATDVKICWTDTQKVDARQANDALTGY